MGGPFAGAMHGGIFLNIPAGAMLVLVAKKGGLQDAFSAHVLAKEWACAILGLRIWNARGGNAAFANCIWSGKRWWLTSAYSLDLVTRLHWWCWQQGWALLFHLPGLESKMVLRMHDPTKKGQANYPLKPNLLELYLWILYCFWAFRCFRTFLGSPHLPW